MTLAERASAFGRSFTDTWWHEANDASRVHAHTRTVARMAERNFPLGLRRQPRNLDFLCAVVYRAAVERWNELCREIHRAQAPYERRVKVAVAAIVQGTFPSPLGRASRPIHPTARVARSRARRETTT